MKVRLLPSTFETDGSASTRQHFSCLIIDGCVAIDAGSLANAVTPTERSEVRDVVLTHAHLDHIAGLPSFIDDLFPVLTEPVRVHATREIIDTLETHIFNWQVYPRFSELSNRHGKVIEYFEIVTGRPFRVRELSITPVTVNHKVPSSGFVLSDGKSTIAISGDTAEMDLFWEHVNALERLDAVLIECAFPDEFSDLASVAFHLTPSKLIQEIAKLEHSNIPIWVMNIKPAYRDSVVRELEAGGIENLKIMEVGRTYDF